jgi:hypothetical protein
LKFFVLELQTLEIELSAVLWLEKLLNDALLDVLLQAFSLQGMSLRKEEGRIVFVDFISDHIKVLIVIEVFQDFAHGIVHLIAFHRDGLWYIKLNDKLIEIYLCDL